MMMSSQPSGGQAHATAGTGGIEKRLTWRLLFFVAAVCTLSSGVIAVVKLLFTFPPALMSFFSEIFLVILGLIMCITDQPFSNPGAMISMARSRIFKYMLFLDRFSGRGMWYCFLGTMIWSALWDLEISWLLGFILGLFVILLGIVTMLYGIQLSLKLDVVRKALMENDHPTGSAPVCPDRGFTKDGFHEVTMSVNATKLSDDEMDYVINALAFTPDATVINKLEYNYWLQKGMMAIV